MEFNFDDIQSADVLDDDLIDLIGTYGYFSNQISMDLNKWSKKCQLKQIVIDNDGMYFVANSNSKGYKFFLPEDKVKRNAKKWRAFTSIDEFCTCTTKKLNSEIIYRNKMTNDTFHAVITRITVSNNAIDLGAHTYSLYNLFKYYELYNDWSPDHFEWQPFGVEE